MPAPTIGTRPRFLIPKSATVDRTHPSAAGLAFCTVPSVGFDDIVYGYKAAVSGTPKAATTAFGPSISSDPGTYGNYWTYSGISDTPFTGPITVMWVGAFTTNWTTGGQQIIGKNPSGVTNANKSFHMYTSGGGKTPTFLRGNSAGGIFYNTPGVALTVGQTYVVIVTTGQTMNTGSTIDWWLNGTFYSPTPAVTTGVPGGAGGALVVSGNGLEVTSGYPTVNLAAIWSRRMGHGEAEMLSADPFCFLRTA